MATVQPTGPPRETGSARGTTSAGEWTAVGPQGVESTGSSAADTMAGMTVLREIPLDFEGVLAAESGSEVRRAVRPGGVRVLT